MDDDQLSKWKLQLVMREITEIDIKEKRQILERNKLLLRM